MTNLAAGLLGAAILTALAAWVAVASVQQDFAAYHTAGQARSLGRDPYLNLVGTPGGPWDGLAVYRHSRFLYPPLLAELFRPLAALPFAWAKRLFTLLSLAGLVGALRLATTTERRDLGLMILAAAVWPPVFLALERGQLDLLLFPLLAVAWRMRHQRPAVAGACLAACALAKPSVLVVLPVALLLRGRRAFALTAATVACLGVLLGAGALVSGLSLSREYFRQVLPRAALHGEGGPEEWLLEDARFRPVADDLENGIVRIDGRAYAQGLGNFRRSASLARWLTPEGDAPSTGLSLAIVAVLGGGLALMARRQPEAPGWFWGALMVGVLAAPVSWAMSLTWSSPLLLLGWVGSPPAAGVTVERATALRIAATAMFAFGFVGLATPAGWVLSGIAAVATAALSSRASPEPRPRTASSEGER